mmetsp:Transcript_2508/g.4433  ORF Transcript_2508/g.4433 Transcript_2508/m.4433 type:complete len:89 (+) Transcript_2508:647-913(+)
MLNFSWMICLVRTRPCSSSVARRVGPDGSIGGDGEDNNPDAIVALQEVLATEPSSSFRDDQSVGTYSSIFEVFVGIGPRRCCTAMVVF